MKNYVQYVFGLAVLVTLMTVALRYIPDYVVKDAGLKRADILSELNRAHNPDRELDELPAEVAPAGEDRQIGDDGIRKGDGLTVRSLVGLDSLAFAEGDTTRTVSLIYVDIEEPETDSIQEKPEPVRQATGKITPIIDYSEDTQMLAKFTAQLQNVGHLRRPVRIGFLGDSFIEGDLITADFRQLMQDTYGGGGVGFVPITSQVAGFRQTVGHKFGSWEQSSIVTNKGTGFTISAYNYTPGEGGYVEYKGTKHKPHLDRFDQARLLYISRGQSTIRATVNGSEEFLFNTEPSPVLQEALLEGEIRSIKYTINEVDGFTAYGVFLENSRGVSVDNFSVRGNTGIVMSRINPTLTAQFANLAKYDMIVVQYGLNMVSSDVMNYSGYRDQMTAVVDHIKRCFPNAAILIMSVGDRATREEGQFVTMPGIREMVRAQQQVAENCGVLFWNTYDMMKSLGGMGTFVKNGWAAKDYTHIGAKGGQKIAKGLFDAVIQTK